MQDFIENLQNNCSFRNIFLRNAGANRMSTSDRKAAGLRELAETLYRALLYRYESDKKRIQYPGKPTLAESGFIL